MKPLIVSTGESLSSTHAMSYATRSRVVARFVEPDQRLERAPHRRRRVRQRRLAGGGRCARSARRSGRRRGRPLRRARRRASRAASSGRTARRTPSRSAIVTPAYRLFALAARMSRPSPGVLLRDQRIDGRIEERTAAAARAARRASRPRRSGNRAPLPLRRSRAAVAQLRPACTSARTSAPSCCCADRS